MISRYFSAACALVFALNAQAGALLDKTDRFTGNRSVRWNSLPAQSEGWGFSSYAFYPKGYEKPYAYGLSLLTWAERWQFLDCHHINWLIDGEPASDLKFEYSHEMAGSATTERFDMRADRPTLERLASAKLVEFSVCGKEDKISDIDLAGIRQVLKVTE
ncbi:hypothetical protein [Pseudomonas fluorescens group sp. PF-69]